MTVFDDFMRVIREMWPENRCAVLVGCYTGLSLTVVLRLVPGHLIGDTICFGCKCYPIPHDLALALRRNSSRFLLFPGRDYAFAPRTRQAVYKDMIRARRQVGVHTRFTPMSCRKLLRFKPL